MNVLVLGGTNFIGRVIVEHLRAANMVTVLNRGTRPIWDSPIRQLTADRDSATSVAEALSDSYDAVVDVSATELRHIDTTAPVLRDLGVQRYIFISSGSVYDSRAVPSPFREDATAVGGDPVWGPYGAAKAACERRLRELAFAELSVLRPPYVYGPHNSEQREQFLWARLLEGRPIYVPGDGTTRIQFCPVGYLADVVRYAVEGALPTGTFNVAEDQAYTLDAYVAILGEVARMHPHVVHVSNESVPAREYFPFRRYDLVLSTQALRAACSVRPVDLRDGLQSTLNWLRTYGAITYAPTERERQWSATR